MFFGTEEDILHWIAQFNMLQESIKIDKWSIGNKVECMELDTFKESRSQRACKTLS